MRIVIIGQAPFGAKTLETLVDMGENVVAAYTPPEKPGTKPDPLKEAALKRGIQVFQPATYKNEQTRSEFAELRPDLAVLAFAANLIPTYYFEKPTHGAICYHPSLLPRHRGASSINWALIMGDTRTGLSIFWPDKGIDTGPILLQRDISIGEDDTAGSLYFNHLFPMGIEAIVESVELVKSGKAPKIAQDESGATYEPPCNDRVAAIDWRKTGPEIHNLIRGCDPQPGAFAYFREEMVRFYGSRFLRSASDAVSGNIDGVDQSGIRISVPGGQILVTKVRPGTVGKMDANQWAADVGLKAGDRFESRA